MQILVTPQTVYLFVFALLNILVAGFIVSRSRKAASTRLLALLFGIWALFWIIRVVATGVVLDFGFGPLPFACMLVALAVHLHFAYALYGNPYPLEARVVVPLGYGLALALAAHPAWAGVTGLLTGDTPLPYAWKWLWPETVNIAVDSVALIQLGTLLLLVWSVVVMLRKSVWNTRQAAGPPVSWARALWHPLGRDAHAQLAFVFPWTFAVTAELLQRGFFKELIAVWVGGGAVDAFATYAIPVFWALHPITFVLAYITFSTEPTSLRVKLSGAALVVALAVFTALLTSIFPGARYHFYDHEDFGVPAGEALHFGPQPQGGYLVERRPLRPLPDLHPEALGARLDLRNGPVQVATDFAFPLGGETYDSLYVSGWHFLATLGTPPLGPYDRGQLLNQQPQLVPLFAFMHRPPGTATYADGALYARRDPGRLTITWHEVWCCRRLQRTTIQLTVYADGAFTFGYPSLDPSIHPPTQSSTFLGFHLGGDAKPESFMALRDPPHVASAANGLVDPVGLRFRTMVHERMMPLLVILLSTIAAVLIGFPRLLRTSLTTPIGRLLDGVRRVDGGERDVTVPVRSGDEVGRLTRYFNRMTASLKKTEADLRDYAEHLEVRVVDRTAALRAEKEKTERQAERLRELDEAKSRFFANVSHELRTPLTLILGPLRDALSGSNRRSALQANQLSAMHRSAERLLTLVDELLDLARLDAGRLRLRVAEHDIVALTRRTVLGFTSRAERERISLAFDADRDRLDAWVDAERYERVVSNLLTNAFKFTPSGGRVRVMLREEGGTAVLMVRDTGEGIREDLLPHVFDRFRQGDDAATRRHEGAGIGLALVREIVELHGGQVAVESEVGLGTAFTVGLPLGKEHFDAKLLLGDRVTPPPLDTRADVLDVARLDGSEFDGWEDDDANSPPVRTDATVLVVEDHDDMRAYLRDLLAPHYHLEEAAGGEAGLETARRLAAEDGAPDLIISDVMMPGMDGYALCHAIKADGILGHVPVVLLTARADVASKLEGLSEGADDYLAKPFSADELLARCENLIEVRRRLRARFSGEVVVKPTEVIVEREEAEWLEVVKTICDEHLPDANFGVDWLAGELDVSTRTLQRRLKEASGLTPGAFLRTLRLERAAQLLEQGAESVAEVAQAVGYDDPEWFSRVFRQGFGVPPSTYEDQVRSKGKA